MNLRDAFVFAGQTRIEQLRAELESSIRMDWQAAGCRLQDFPADARKAARFLGPFRISKRTRWLMARVIEN